MSKRLRFDVTTTSLCRVHDADPLVVVAAAVVVVSMCSSYYTVTNISVGSRLSQPLSVKCVVFYLPQQ